MKNEEQLYVVAELLKQLGFRKKTEKYIIKTKKNKLHFFNVNTDNFWRVRHVDFNSKNKYLPQMGRCWDYTSNKKGVPYYQPFEEEGTLYSLPTMWQIVSFCTRRGIILRNCDDVDTTISDLIFAFRKKTKQRDAFSKYLSVYAQQKGKQTKLKV